MENLFSGGFCINITRNSMTTLPAAISLRDIMSSVKAKGTVKGFVDIPSCEILRIQRIKIASIVLYT